MFLASARRHKLRRVSGARQTIKTHEMKTVAIDPAALFDRMHRSSGNLHKGLKQRACATKACLSAAAGSSITRLTPCRSMPTSSRAGALGRCIAANVSTDTTAGEEDRQHDKVNLPTRSFPTTNSKFSTVFFSLCSCLFPQAGEGFDIARQNKRFTASYEAFGTPHHIPLICLTSSLLNVV